MGDFKVGDIIRGKKTDMYIITDEDMYNAKVLRTYDDRMEIQILEYNSNYGCFIGKKYSVLNSKQYFELVKANKFYKTLPNDFTGKLTIDKGQVIKKEEKKEILDEVEKEYLKAVIKPFRGKIVSISKEGSRCHGEYINIVLADENITFPFFKDGTMYKGMKQGKRYNLQELGL